MANISARDRGALLIYSFICVGVGGWQNATQSRQPNRQKFGCRRSSHPIPSSFFHGCLAPFFWLEVRSLSISCGAISQPFHIFQRRNWNSFGSALMIFSWFCPRTSSSCHWTFALDFWSKLKYNYLWSSVGGNVLGTVGISIHQLSKSNTH